MKLSTKIILLALALLGFLGGNAYISWQEITKIQSEFNSVVKYDLILMESATALNNLQLKKEILFEKLTSSAEELAFGNSNESRKQYLLDYVNDLQDQFKSDQAIVNSRINQAMHVPGFSQTLVPVFEHVRQAATNYDQKVEAIFKAVAGAGYQLSMEDLDQVESQQMELSAQLKKALAEVWFKVNGSVERINELQQKGQQVLWGSLILSFIFALILVSAIIHRINSALRSLVSGVRALHQGKVGVQVEVRSKDEIGELAKAFNHMSHQLKTYQEEMHRTNAELSGSLTTTNKQKQELERINRDLDRFVHLISHDIKSPITAMMFYGDYLYKHQEGLDPKVQHSIEGINKVSHRLNLMVTDLLEMTKITRMKRPFERVDISQVVQSALERQEFNIQRTSAVIRQPQSYPFLMGDRIKLTIVFYNLIGNAIKYSSKDGNKPVVEISWQKRLVDHQFCIKDNGIGIAKEHFKDVFGMFKRLPEAESFEGSGVGLAIVQEIIQEHGGQIWVDSAPGCGTQFFFTIPLESSSHFS